MCECGVQWQGIETGCSLAAFDLSRTVALVLFNVWVSTLRPEPETLHLNPPNFKY